jgi:hypothetical protein
MDSVECAGGVVAINACSSRLQHRVCVGASCFEFRDFVACAAEAFCHCGGGFNGDASSRVSICGARARGVLRAGRESSNAKEGKHDFFHGQLDLGFSTNAQVRHDLTFVTTPRLKVVHMAILI